MVADTAPPEDLDTAVAELYGGPPEGFVNRRDALARALRGAGRKEEAAAVKAMRKPARAAWALDAAALTDSQTVERLARTVARVVEAQSAGSDVADALAELRAGVRDMAAAAAQAASEGGHRVEQAVLVPAVLAVVGEPDALAALRAGRLVEVPSPGGFGAAAKPPAATPARPKAPRAVTGTRTRAPAPDTAGPAARTRSDREVARARRALEKAEVGAATAGQRAVATQRAAGDAAVELEAAEDRLRRAERDVQAARARFEKLDRTSEAARERLRRADDAVGAARAALHQLGD